MKPETFYNLLAEQNLPLSDQQKKQFERYFELLVEWNEKINLTAITDKDEVYLKHFYDSIAPILQGLIPNETIKLLDIGAGAGLSASTSYNCWLKNWIWTVFISTMDVPKILPKTKTSVLNMIL